MRKRDVEDEEHKEDDRHTRRRMFRLRDDFLSKIRAHVGAHYFIAIVKYLTVEEAYQVSNLNVEIERYFHTYGVWQEYARDYFRRNGDRRLDDVVRDFGLAHKRTINYFWIVLLDYAESRSIEQFVFSNTPNERDRTYHFWIQESSIPTVEVSFGDTMPSEDRARLWDIFQQKGWEIGTYIFTGQKFLARVRVFVVAYTLLEEGFYLSIRRGSTNYIRSQLKC